MKQAPVLGPLREQPPHRRLTDFMEFSSPLGIEGLARYGFRAGFDIDDFGQWVDVMDWCAASPPAAPC